MPIFDPDDSCEYFFSQADEWISYSRVIGLLGGSVEVNNLDFFLMRDIKDTLCHTHLEIYLLSFKVSRLIFNADKKFILATHLCQKNLW